MTGKQLIILGMLVSSTYIYFSFKYISQDLLKENNTTAPIKPLNSKEKNNTKVTEEIPKEIKLIQVPKPLEKPVTKAPPVIKEIVVQHEPVEVKKQIIKQVIKKETINDLESEIEAALKEISTSQAINK